MMSVHACDIPLARFDDGDLIELPYQGNAFSMVFFLPKDTSSIWNSLWRFICCSKEKSVSEVSRPWPSGPPFPHPRSRIPPPRDHHFGCNRSALKNVPVVPNTQLSLAINWFSQNLLQKLDNSGENVLISPFSISSILSTLLAGAEGRTHQQLIETLGYSTRNLTEAEVLGQLTSLKQSLNGQFNGTSNVLQIADGLAVQKNYTILDSFRRDLQGHELMEMDFEAQQATDQINEWVNIKTNAKIPKLFDGNLDPSTKLLLLNAVYFKGLWLYNFKKESTTKKPFYGPNSQKKEILVDMMSLSDDDIPCASFEDGDMIELKYKCSSISMLFFLPKAEEGKSWWQSFISAIFGSSESSVSTVFGSKNLSERVAQLKPYHLGVDVQIPKFKIEQSYSLKEPLTNLGIRDAFEPSADFSRITGSRDLFVSQIVHKTYIEVNEDGAEAAAATGLKFIPECFGCSSPGPIQFIANRPFLFVIYDHTNQVALFTGVVNKP